MKFQFTGCHLSREGKKSKRWRFLTVCSQAKVFRGYVRKRISIKWCFHFSVISKVCLFLSICASTRACWFVDTELKPKPALSFTHINLNWLLWFIKQWRHICSNLICCYTNVWSEHSDWSSSFLHSHFYYIFISFDLSSLAAEQTDAESLSSFYRYNGASVNFRHVADIYLKCICKVR